MSLSLPSYRVNLTTGEQVATMRQKVERLERAMYSLPQADCPVRHYFAPGLYAREITIPKGVTLVGAIHKRQNLAVLSKGRLQIVTDEGTEVIEAPCTMTVQAGAKNCAIALDEAVWTNFFATDTTDVDALVEELTFSKASELLGGAENKQLLENKRLMELEN